MCMMPLYIRTTDWLHIHNIVYLFTSTYTHCHPSNRPRLIIISLIELGVYTTIPLHQETKRNKRRPYQSIIARYESGATPTRYNPGNTFYHNRESKHYVKPKINNNSRSLPNQIKGPKSKRNRYN